MKKQGKKDLITVNSVTDTSRRIPIIALLPCLSLVSASLFIYQVTLTRVFSPMLRYHFVFLVTSMAIFGLGIGGYIAYRLDGRKRKTASALRLPEWLMILAASYILSFSLIYKLPFLDFYVVYSIIAALPFLAGGVFISMVFKIFSSQSYKLYFADLLGAGLGSVTVVFFINQWGIVNTVLIAIGFTVISSLVLSFYMLDKKEMVVPISIAVILGVAGIYQPGIRQFEERFTGYFTSPLTSLSTFRSANAAHSLLDWNWDAYSRTDLIKTGTFRQSRIVSIDGGSNSEMIRFDGDLSKVSWLKQDLNYLPFETGSNRKTLLIGPGGGKDILLAILAGSRDIQAVEINNGSVRMAEKYASYNGGIYNRKEVTLHVQDGRNFVKQAPAGSYDLIYLAQVMTDATETVGFALAENFIYTKEAVKDYWNALNDQGRLAFILHDEKDMTRLLLTIQESLADMGIPEEQFRKRLILVNRRMPGSSPQTINMPLLMVRKSPFTPMETAEIFQEIKSGRHTPIYIPYVTGEKFWTNLKQFRDAAKKLKFTQRLNFTPTTDDRPYFFDFESSINTSLLIILAGVILITLLLFKPAFRKTALKRSPYYFIGLGLAFMLIEIPLIQKFTLFLGHPTRSFIVVLIALLSGGGAGSLAGGWKRFHLNRKYLPLILVSLFAPVVFILINTVINNWQIKSLELRVLVSFGLLFPLGFFMGMPFPHGIKTLNLVKKENAVPLMWGINGTMSVGGSVLAVIISMKIGFSFSIAAGALIYLVLFLFMPLYEKKWGPVL